MVTNTRISVRELGRGWGGCEKKVKRGKNVRFSRLENERMK
jgi:hypothetical protein